MYFFLEVDLASILVETLKRKITVLLEKPYLLNFLLGYVSPLPFFNFQVVCERDKKTVLGKVGSLEYFEVVTVAVLYGNTVQINIYTIVLR